MVLVMRILYLTWLGVMGYWYSLPTLNWFAMEPNPHGTHDVVSFNFHPLFMSLAILCLMSEGVVSYRSVRMYATHATAKLVHACCMATSVLCVGAGLTVIFVNHHQKGIKHLYSAHSWLGVCIAGFFALQGLQGATVFYGLGGGSVTSSVRRAVLPVHRGVGVVLYYVALLTICLGLQEKAGFLGGTPACKADVYCKEVVCVNILVGITVAIGATVALLLTPGEDQLLRSTSDTDYGTLQDTD